jgi:excisionase family DNA binding protein
MAKGIAALDDRQTISVPEAGRALGISRNAAYEAARRGEIPTIKFGKRLVVPLARFDRLLAGDKGAQ